MVLSERQQPGSRHARKFMARTSQAAPPVVLLLLVVLVAQPVPGKPGPRGRRVLAEQAAGQGLRAGTPPAATPLGREDTYLRCSGQTPQTRACLAYNLFYHIPALAFVAFGYGDDSSAPASSRLPAAAVEDFTLEHYNLTLAPRAAAPDPARTLVQPGLNVHWRFMTGGASYSIGHALVHELFPLFHTLDNLLAGRVPHAFNLVTQNGAVPAVFSHIMLATHDRQINWTDLCRRATESGKEWIQLEAATLGDGGHVALAQAIHYQHHPGPTMFNSAGWARFRSWMLRSAGLDPAALPARPLLVLNDKVMPDGTLEWRRRIYNIEAVAKHLQDALPATEVQRVAFMALPWRQQLHVMAGATVFVTTEGSSSFRYVFLPPGASIILLSHPDNITEGADVVGAFHQFHEVDKYFPLNWLYFFKYVVNVDHADQYVVEAVTPEGGKVERHAQLYNAHIVVQLDRVTAMARAALRLHTLHNRLYTRYTAVAGVV